MGWRVVSRHGDIGLDDYVKRGHLLLSPGGKGKTGFVDDSLQALGHARRVTVTYTDISSMMEILTRTEDVATLPSAVANRIAPRYGLQSNRPPIDILEFPIALYRRDDGDHQMGLRWLRNQIAATFQNPSQITSMAS